MLFVVGTGTGSVRRRSPQRAYVGPVHDGEVSGHDDVSSERPDSAAVCCCHDNQLRWPRSCVNANQLTRSLSGRLSRAPYRDLSGMSRSLCRNLLLFLHVTF